MSARTYIPMLLVIANRFCRYVQKYQNQMNHHLTEEQKDLLDAATSACVALTESIGVLPVNP